MPPYLLRTTCRLCEGPSLDPILDLGELAFSAFPLPTEDLAVVDRAPLELCQCRTCSLVQLRQTVKPELLYQQYWYRSSINEAMRVELKDIVRAALLETSVFTGDTVVDVGANDGYLLSCYPRLRVRTNGITRIAYEPAANLQEALAPHAEVVVQACFPPSAADLPTGVKILTSIAMFYDLDDPHAFVRAVDRCLHPEGVWIVQFQDLGQMVEATAFDNCCHEHLTYWSLAAFQKVLAGSNLRVTHAEIRAINGGSLRLHVRRKTYVEQPSVEHCLLLERLSVDWQALERFAWKVDAARVQIRDVVREARQRGLTIDLYGASTKGNTMCQYVGLGPDLIRQAIERNPEKYGRVTATGIPIVDEDEGRANPADLWVCAIWQFREAVLQREAAYLERGGRILFPLPEVDIVSTALSPLDDQVS